MMKFKYSLLKELYEVVKSKLNKDPEYKKFIEDNIEWLKAYAAFCYLRDKNLTANFNTWKFNSVYENTAVAQRYAADGQRREQQRHQASPFRPKL